MQNWFDSITGGAAKIIGAYKGQPSVDDLSNRANGTPATPATNGGMSPWIIGGALIAVGLLVVGLIFRGR